MLSLHNFISLFDCQEIRLIVRELDQTAREVSLVLQQIHQTDGLTKSRLPKICFYRFIKSILKDHIQILSNK